METVEQSEWGKVNTEERYLVVFERCPSGRLWFGFSVNIWSRVILAPRITARQSELTFSHSVSCSLTYLFYSSTVRLIMAMVVTGVFEHSRRSRISSSFEAEVRAEKLLYKRGRFSSAFVVT